MKRIDPVTLLESLVSIPSPSGREDGLARWVMQWAADQGLCVSMMGRNVVVAVGCGGGRRLLLGSHLDTVPPARSWTTDPFVPDRQGDRIIGLGANDAKGCVAAMLTAVAGLEAGGMRGEVVLALTVNEETGRGDGLEWLIHEIGTIDAAVIGEPSGLDVCIAQKGLLILEVETGGEACHAAHARSIGAPNAVVEAAKAILAIQDVELGSHPLLGPVTCEVTVVGGGDRSNVIPDRCTFLVDVRTVKGISTADVVGEIGRRTGASVKVGSDRMRPFETDGNEPLVRAALAARPEARLCGSATMSDGVWTRHLPTIKVGPGQSERSHTAGEYITRTELKEGAAFYGSLVREYLS